MKLLLCLECLWAVKEVAQSDKDETMQSIVELEGETWHDEIPDELGPAEER